MLFWMPLTPFTFAATVSASCRCCSVSTVPVSVTTPFAVYAVTGWFFSIGSWVSALATAACRSPSGEFWADAAVPARIQRQAASTPVPARNENFRKPFVSMMRNSLLQADLSLRSWVSDAAPPGASLICYFQHQIR